MKGSQCGGCGGENRWLLPHRGSLLCTNCILMAHQGLFCPFCYHVYQASLPPNQCLLCIRCPSVSHRSCHPSSSPSSFLCPSCSNPNFSFDKQSPRALVAAAEIAAASMTKAAAVARVEADRRVKEAALAKKRAREALQTLAFFSTHHKHSLA